MRTLLVLALAALVPGVAAADREITPLFGYRQGTVEFSTGIFCITLEGVRCPSFAKSEDSTTFGFLVDLPLTERLDVELLVNRQATEVFFHDGSQPVPREPGVNRGDFDLNHFHAGLRYGWELGRLEPFAAFGVGLTTLESPRLYDGEVDEVRGSASVAGGARVGLSERLGLRVEARAYRVDLPDNFGRSLTVVGKDNLDQTELTAGLAVRF